MKKLLIMLMLMSWNSPCIYGGDDFSGIVTLLSERGIQVGVVGKTLMSDSETGKLYKLLETAEFEAARVEGLKQGIDLLVGSNIEWAIVSSPKFGELLEEKHGDVEITATSISLALEKYSDAVGVKIIPLGSDVSTFEEKAIELEKGTLRSQLVSLLSQLKVKNWSMDVVRGTGGNKDSKIGYVKSTEILKGIPSLEPIIYNDRWVLSLTALKGN